MKLDKEDILHQLDKIISSSTFSSSQKLQRFLSYVVNQSQQGNEDILIQYNIAINAFGRELNFEAASDPIVRIQAGRLRTCLSVYYKDEGKDDPILISIPTGAYIPKFSKNTKNSIKPLPSRDNVIAVEAFKSLFNNTSQQYISDGFTEELLLEMARYGHLVVIRLLSNYNQESRKARFLLRGSLRFKGANIKLIISLDDVEFLEQIWSEEFEVEFNPDELIYQQEKIAKKIANIVGDVIGGKVHKRLTIESKKRTGNQMIPYDSLLKFYHFQKEPAKERYLDALNITKKALEIDPESGITWALLGNLAINNIALQLDPNVELSLKETLNYTTKGVQYEPKMQLTRAYHGFAYLMNGQLNEAIVQLKMAYELNPNTAFYAGAIGWALLLAGENKQGLKLIEKGIYLNPDYPKWYHLAPCSLYIGQGKYQDALIEANQLNIPGLFWDPLMKAVCYGHLSMAEGADFQIKLLLKLFPEFQVVGNKMISMYIKDSIQKKMILKGLEKAGMNINLTNIE